MTTGQVIVLMASVFVLCGATIVAIVGGALVWGVRRIEPINQLEAQILGLRAQVEALDGQVTKLRTSKAGRVSNAKRAAAETEDVAGLDPEEQALFREAGLM